MDKIFKSLIKIFWVLALASCVNAFAASLQWQTLAPGLEYTKVNTFAGIGNKGIHAFRFDLQRYQLQLAFTQQQNRLTNIIELMNTNHAIIGVNGGFFTPDLKPLGLRIAEGQIKSPLKNTAWWGVFFTKGAQAAIVSPNSFKASKKINFAVQSGPRLIVNGQITNLKPGMANRTALGITRDNKIVLLVSNGFPLSTQELAKIMQAPENQGGLNCFNALNLDGGSSTQLYARINKFSLSVPSFAMVTDAVLVIPKIQ